MVWADYTMVKKMDPVGRKFVFLLHSKKMSQSVAEHKLENYLEIIVTFETLSHFGHYSS